MQGYFRLPWCSDQIAPKMQISKAAPNSMRASPVLDVQTLSKLKRKRTNSPEPSAQSWVNKRQRAESEAATSPPATAPVPAKSEREREHVTVKAEGPSLAEVGPVDGLRLALGNQATMSHDEIEPVQNRNEVPAVSQGMPEPKTSRAQQAAPRISENVSMTDANAFATEDVRGMSPLQQVIENEFNMQILMKHNELRLIEQETAKCQVALEQLRRCEVRPFPGAEQPIAQVSTGIGKSVAPPPGYSQPTYAAPHGVTDGPYTRHYRQWLLPDPQFDPLPPQNVAYGEIPEDVRSTRNAGSARKSVQKSFTMPSRADSMKSLPNYPTSHKDKTQPLVLRRSTDGQLVKLICNNCLRGNFSSIQGFLNHCRIAHKVDYKSHDAAAVDCGRLLDEQEVANLPPDALTAAVVHKPSTSRSSATTTPFKTHSFVHPMNTAGSTPVRHSVSGHSKPTAPKPTPVPSLASVAQASSSASFTPSASAPRLSAQFAKYNLGGNLQQAITDARQRVDLGSEEVLSPDDLDSASASPSTPVNVGSRSGLGVPSRAGSLAPPGAIGHPQSRKGHRELAARHRPSPLAPAPPNDVRQHIRSEIPDSPKDHSPNLSPNTADSNPGLVSDHEDDDHGSVASEDEVPQSTIAHSLGIHHRGCTDSMDLDVAVNDDIDEHGVRIRRNSLTGGYRPAGSPSRTFGVGNTKGA